MTSRIDRRTVLAAGLLIAFAILTALPWRNHDTLKPSFDTTSNAVLHHHTSAWSDSLWWKCTGLLGLIAGASALVRRRRATQLSVAAALVGLATWSAGTWHVHHARYVLQPTTIAIANFTAGPHIGLVADSQLLSGYLASAVLVGLLLLSSSSADLDLRSQISRSRFRLITGGLLLLAIAILSVLPWYWYDRTYQFGHRLGGDAWTPGYWPAAIVFGLLAAGALLFRSRRALSVGVVAAVFAIALWGVGAWRLQGPHTQYRVISSAVMVGQPGTLVNPSAGSLSVKSSVSQGSIGAFQTIYSVAALVVMAATLVLLLAVWFRSRRPIDPD